MAGVTRVRLPPPSLYVKTPVHDVDGTVFFGLMVPPVMPAATDRIVTVTQGDEQRLDRLAAQYLGDARYWWAIAVLNNLTDPLTQVTTGTLLRIPDRASLN